MIQAKLQKIQSTLKAPKSQYNSFGKYSYRNCEDIYEAAKPVLAKYGCTLEMTDDAIEVGGRVFLRATAVIYDLEDGSNTGVTALAEMPKEKKGMDASQITGAASSYARKYALGGLFLLDDTKDADATNKSGVVLCDHCGNEIEPYTGKNGAEVTPAQHASASKRKFGQVLCLECIDEITDRQS